MRTALAGICHTTRLRLHAPAGCMRAGRIGREDTGDRKKREIFIAPSLTRKGGIDFGVYD